MTLGTSFEKKILESPCPKDAQCQKSMNSGQWCTRRRFLKIIQSFLILPLIDPQKEPDPLFEQL